MSVYFQEAFRGDRFLPQFRERIHRFVKRICYQCIIRSSSVLLAQGRKHPQRQLVFPNHRLWRYRFDLRFFHLLRAVWPRPMRKRNRQLGAPSLRCWPRGKPSGRHPEVWSGRRCRSVAVGVVQNEQRVRRGQRRLQMRVQSLGGSLELVLPFDLGCAAAGRSQAERLLPTLRAHEFNAHPKVWSTPRMKPKLRPNLNALLPGWALPMYPPTSSTKATASSASTVRSRRKTTRSPSVAGMATACAGWLSRW